MSFIEKQLFEILNQVFEIHFTDSSIEANSSLQILSENTANHNQVILDQNGLHQIVPISMLQLNHKAVLKSPNKFNIQQKFNVSYQSQPVDSVNKSNIEISPHLSIKALVIDINSSLDSSCKLTDLQLSQLKNISEFRQKSWILGKLALNKLMSELLIPEELRPINFPNKNFSITHSGDYAFAIYCESPLIQGLGIDFEKKRKKVITERMSKFFLSNREIEQIQSIQTEKFSANKISQYQENLLRLWTIKEALYKSNMQNKDTRLIHYQIENCLSDSGKAFIRGSKGMEFHYQTFKFTEGFFTIAVTF